MQLISKFNNGIRFLLCAINIFSNYTWVIHLKGKKIITITSTFQKMSEESNRTPSKICADKGSKFYNKSMKPWL